MSSSPLFERAHFEERPVVLSKPWEGASEEKLGLALLITFQRAREGDELREGGLEFCRWPRGEECQPEPRAASLRNGKVPASIPPLFRVFRGNAPALNLIW